MQQLTPPDSGQPMTPGTDPKSYGAISTDSQKVEGRLCSEHRATSFTSFPSQAWMLTANSNSGKSSLLAFRVDEPERFAATILTLEAKVSS
jgi:hypothetical protein